MSDLESLVPQRFGALTAAETKLLQNAGIGELAVCSPNDNLNASFNDPTGADTWGTDRSIRGELIGWLCADRKAKDLVDPGGIQVLGAKIIGPLKILSVTVQFPLAFACCQICDEINLQSARTRTLSFTQTHVQSIFADGAVIAGAFFLRNSRAGLLQFSGARIEGQFSCDHSSFNKLILDGGVIDVGVILRHAAGQVKMSRARIGTDLDCEGGSFNLSHGSPGPALDAGGVTVDGSALLRGGFRSLGLVNLLGAQIGLNLDCTGGEFTNPLQTADGTGDALRADAVVVRGTVFLSGGFCARGAVHLTSCQIGRDLNCTGATFENNLTIERADIQGAFFWREVTLAKTADLNLLNTSVGSLSDDRTSWPSQGHLQIHGFVYQRISVFSPRDVKERLAWLARQKSFATHPYRQLAKVLREEGHGIGAQQVLFEMECRRRRKYERGWVARVWSFVFRNTVGYGYYPTSRAAYWLILLTVAGFLFFWGGYRTGSMVPTDKEAYFAYKFDHQLPPLLRALSRFSVFSWKHFSIGQARPDRRMAARSRPARPQSCRPEMHPSPHMSVHFRQFSALLSMGADHLRLVLHCNVCRRFGRYRPQGLNAPRERYELKLEDASMAPMNAGS